TFSTKSAPSRPRGIFAVSPLTGLERTSVTLGRKWRCCAGFRMPAMRDDRRGQPGRRPEAAKERTRGLVCEVSAADYGNLTGADWLLGRAECVVMQSMRRVEVRCRRA